MSLAAGALAAAGQFIREEEKPRKEIEQLRKKDAEPRFATFLERKKQPKTYATKALTGHSFGPPLNDITGLYGKVAEKSNIDFNYQLALMLQKKLARMEGDEPPEEYDIHHDGVLGALEYIYTSYRGQGSMIFEEYRDYTSRMIDEVRNELEWPRLEKFFALQTYQATLLQRFEREIDGDLMVAYAMTELMPTEHGPTNVIIMDFLLQNAGKAYLECVPALGDRELSFGPYQFTSAALKAGEDKKLPHGASVLDSMLQKSVLPPNVASLRGDDHYKAAYLLALYNLALLVKDLGEESCRKLMPQVPKLVGAIQEYVPAAHNGPRDARKEFVRYARSLLTPSHPAHAAPFGHSLDPKLATYVTKTRNNLAAIHSPVLQAKLRLP